MKGYRISLPATIHISVVAESEKQAKMLAVAAVYNPDFPLEIDMRSVSSNNNLIDVGVWVNDETSENPDKCNVLDVRELKDPTKLLQQLERFAQSNGNEKEFRKQRPAL